MWAKAMDMNGNKSLGAGRVKQEGKSECEVEGRAEIIDKESKGRRKERVR